MPLPRKVVPEYKLLFERHVQNKSLSAWLQTTSGLAKMSWLQRFPIIGLIWRGNVRSSRSGREFTAMVSFCRYVGMMAIPSLIPNAASFPVHYEKPSWETERRQPIENRNAFFTESNSLLWIVLYCRGHDLIACIIFSKSRTVGVLSLRIFYVANKLSVRYDNNDLKHLHKKSQGNPNTVISCSLWLRRMPLKLSFTRFELFIFLLFA